MDERPGTCRILGNLCDLWICVRICCSFAVHLGVCKAPMANWPIGQLVNWPSSVGQIGRAMDGWVAVWTLLLHTGKGDLL